MQFTFGQSFLDQLNTGQAQAQSNTELQMRARQVESQLLNDQVNREVARAQNAREELRMDMAQEMHPEQMENLRQQTRQLEEQVAASKLGREVTQEQLDQYRRDNTREFAAPEGYERISEDLGNRDFTFMESVKLAGLIEQLKNGEIDRKTARAQLGALEQANEFNDTLAMLASDVLEAQYNKERTISGTELWDEAIGEDQWLRHEPSEMRGLLEGALANNDLSPEYRAAAEEMLEKLNNPTAGDYATLSGQFDPESLSDINVPADLLATPQERQLNQAMYRLNQGMALHPQQAQSVMPFMGGGAMSMSPNNLLAPLFQGNLMSGGFQMPMPQTPPQQQ